MKQINIGVLVNTHGLKGEVRVKPLTDFPEIRFSKGNTIYLQFKNTTLPLVIKTIRESKGLLLLTFDGYHDINQVEPWKGSYITIDIEDAHELAEDEAYFFELKECTVYDMEEQVLGDVIEVIETGANAVLRVKGKEKDILIPYVKAFVKEFNRSEKKIYVELMEGLL